MRALEILGMPTDQAVLSELRKGDWHKVLVAVLLRERTSVSNRCLAERLSIGHTGALSRLIGGFQKDKSHMRRLGEITEMLT